MSDTCSIFSIQAGALFVGSSAVTMAAVIEETFEYLLARCLCSPLQGRLPSGRDGVLMGMT